MECYKIENLSFSYPNRKNSTLKNINLTVNQGEFITIMGKSGCGKTTLLRLLKTAISPNGTKNGIVKFFGTDLEIYEEEKQATEIGFVLQSPENQIVTDKVWHELAFGLESLGVKTEEIRAKVAETASFFGIQNWFYKKTAELSGGQKQILNLASVMVTDPKVLILDEPTSQLDPIASQEFFDILKKINHELGTTIIICEHRLEDVIPISDRIVVMENGKIISDASPKKTGENLKNNDMYIALPSIMQIYQSLDNGNDTPLDVREGKKWLFEYESKNNVNKDYKNNLKFDIDEKKELVIEIKDAYFRYDKSENDIIKGLDLKVYKGELFTILGGNGTGKTTTLSLISGLNKPYRGNVFINEKKLHEIPDLYNGVLGVLPQNPQTLFVKKTVRLDLLESLKNEKIGEDEIENRMNKICALCKIGELTESHPYDLSGGEQQRVALAKILLKSPKILLLDEPTKGMDAHFKEIFADILQELRKNDVTVVMVSHDVEFCAKYASRCAMFFDGNIVSLGEPTEFFKGKRFYTTVANRVARDIIPNAITIDDVIVACGGKTAEKRFYNVSDFYKKEEKSTETIKMEKNIKKKKTPFKNVLLALLFAILFVITNVFINKTNSADLKIVLQIFSIIEAGGIFLFILPKKNLNVTKMEKKESAKKSNILMLLLLLTAVILTIFVGIHILKGKKYYFISLLIILETMIPFIVNFEKRSKTTREIVTLSVLCAIAVVGREAFVAIPQFKPVMSIVIIAAVAFGSEAVFLTGAVSAFLSNFMFGQGPWTPWQMFAFGLVGFFAGILSKYTNLLKTKTSLCVFGGLTTLFIYGIIMNISTVIQYQAYPTFSMIVSYCIMGIPFDVVHALSTVFFLWLISDEMLEKLERLKTKYKMY